MIHKLVTVDSTAILVSGKESGSTRFALHPDEKYVHPLFGWLSFPGFHMYLQVYYVNLFEFQRRYIFTLLHIFRPISLCIFFIGKTTRTNNRYEIYTKSLILHKTLQTLQNLIRSTRKPPSSLQRSMYNTTVMKIGRK